MVYQALQGRMGNELHALALQTSAPPDVLTAAGAEGFPKASKRR